MSYAFKLLSYRGRSEKEMIEKLRMKGFDDSDIDRVIVRLRSAGFLDDRQLASSLKRYAEESKLLSVLGTKKLLAGRGVPKDLIQQTVEGINETELARKLVEKKIASWTKYSPPGERQLTADMIKKLYGVLFRRGYPPETIRRTLEKFKSKEDVELKNIWSLRFC